MHDNDFFIASIEHSGASWLAELLNKSPSHTVRGDEACPQKKGVHRDFSEFPIERFKKAENYGECSNRLRFHLSPGLEGFERLIPKRVFLVRNPHNIVRSWMNRDGRTIQEYSSTVQYVLSEFYRLEKWAESSRAKVIEVEKLINDLDYLNEFLEWLDVGIVATKEDQKNQINNNDGGWFFWDNEIESDNGVYDKHLKQVFQRIKSRIYYDQYNGHLPPLDFGEAGRRTPHHVEQFVGGALSLPAAGEGEDAPEYDHDHKE